MQHEITEIRRVFAPDGEVHTAGWARAPVFVYNEPLSKSAGKHGERDCYFLNNGEVSLYLSVENMGLEFAIKIAIADLRRGGVISDYVIKKIRLLKTGLPKSDINGEFLYSDKRVQLQITHTPTGRFLKGDFIDFAGYKNLYFNVVLQENRGDSLNMLAPFERNRKYFYLKRFLPKFVAVGIIRVGGFEYQLTESNGRAYFDRARFFKPHHHHYMRLGADCILDGRRFSLCFAGRVGDNRYGNENCFFTEGKLHKLGNIGVKGNPKHPERPLFFSSSQPETDITFKPFTVRGAAMRAVMAGDTVVFGRIYGELHHPDFPQPLIIENAQAHLVISEF